MSDKDNRQKDEKFSPGLLHAISANEIGCFTDLPLLPPNDVAVLKQILRGEERPPVPIDKKRAVNALARSERSAEASEILARVVSDPKETTRVRAAAAAHLGVMPPEPAEKALVENLNTDNEIVRSEILKSLGRVGTSRTLDRLKELPEPKNDYAKKQLAVTKLAISFRSGNAERDALEKANHLGLRWTTQSVKPVQGKVVKERIDAIWGSTYGIALNPDAGFEIECGRTTYMIVLNDAIKRGAFLDSALSRNMITGLVVVEEAEIRHVTVRYLIMTSPSERGLELTVTRTNGDVAYVGEVRPDGDDFQVRMRDVGLERTATEITGRVSNADIQLSIRVLQSSVRPKRHVVPVVRNGARAR